MSYNQTQTTKDQAAQDAWVASWAGHQNNRTPNGELMPLVITSGTTRTWITDPTEIDALWAEHDAAFGDPPADVDWSAEAFQ